MNIKECEVKIEILKRNLANFPEVETEEDDIDLRNLQNSIRSAERHLRDLKMEQNEQTKAEREKRAERTKGRIREIVEWIKDCKGNVAGDILRKNAGRARCDAWQSSVRCFMPARPGPGNAILDLYDAVAYLQWQEGARLLQDLIEEMAVHVDACQHEVSSEIWKYVVWWRTEYEERRW